MPYTQQLNKLINESGLSIKEIAEKCSKNGHTITASYISLLRNMDNKRIPSDEMSRALAIACNAKIENILIVEAYIDKAPKELETLFEMIRDSIITTILSVLENQIPKNELKKYVDTFKQMPLADLFIEASKMPKAEMEKGKGTLNLQGSIKDEEVNAVVQFNHAIGLPVIDDSMFPVLQKGSKTILEALAITDYIDGDILCFMEKGHKEMMYRKCAFIDGLHKKVAMFPMNTQFPSSIYNYKEIVILGKVKQIITDF